MAGSISTEVRVRRKVKDGWFVYTCEQLPGLYVAHPDDAVAYEDLPGAISALFKLDYGVECQVIHKLSYADFVKRLVDQNAAEAVNERTSALMAEGGAPASTSPQPATRH